MCERCPELEERIAWLEGELGERIEATRFDRLQRSLRIRPAPAKMLLILYAAKGRVIPVDQLDEMVPPKDAHKDRLRKIVDVYVCSLRKVVGHDGIINSWGKGYFLSPVGMSRVAKALGEDARAAA